MRSAFSMLTAIVIIVLMSSVAAFVVNLSGKMSQETTLTYQKEQAALYAKSYTELAIMAATSQVCIQGIRDQIGNPAIGNGYNIIVNVQYIGNELNGVANCNTLGVAIATANSQRGSIIIDTYVQYINPNHPNIGTLVPVPLITFHRRTLQRL